MIFNPERAHKGFSELGLDCFVLCDEAIDQRKVDALNGSGLKWG